MLGWKPSTVITPMLWDSDMMAEKLQLACEAVGVFLWVARCGEDDNFAE